MNFSEKCAHSWALLKTAILYIRRDPELIWYSVISFLISFAIFLALLAMFYFVPAFEFIFKEEAYTLHEETLLVIIGFAYYLIFSLIKYFFQAAITTSIERRLEWKDNAFWDGIRSATDKFGKIFIWSMVETTIFTLIRFIQNRFGENSIIGKIIANILGGAWNILTYFSFSLLILSKKNT